MFIVGEGNMEVVLGVIAIPAIISAIIVVYIWYVDKYEREPLKYVALMFSWGILSAMLALFLEELSFGIMSYEFLYIALIGPIIEEFSKGLGLFVFSKNDEYEGPMDGLVYGISVGAGFALFENILYILAFYYEGGIGSALVIAIVRAVFEPIGHPLFTGWFAYDLGRDKLGMKGKFSGFLTAIALHILWNTTALFAASNGFGSVLFIIITFLYANLLRERIKDGLLIDKLLVGKNIKEVLM